MKKKITYWVVSAQMPFHLFKGIFNSEAEARRFAKKIPDKRCPLVYRCPKEMIRNQFGWRNYMEKWLK